ncbi:branched-chain amino acid ABC transporter permease [Lutibaculum baratangense]|uniref:High-affinity branched-chain amino acid transport system permease protein LivH n=1 Tax=Lutibaculum baratangense AMV1 TaxID=631454 RepID=V4RJN7_9HYPH|nr:branched-chain amino acid ABC transporter permease [Lutibaculum baratangense]ESR23450.1 High-affinity branched-chain amino acid transport system permease protein LivH [Lutibaculum baratangense AMV1]
MDIIIPLLVDGLAAASLIFFIAVGLTLVFSVLRVLNVAHGSFYSIGAYVAVSIGGWAASAGLSPWLSFPILLISAALVAALLGPFIEATFIRYTYGKPEALQILVTFALFLIFEDLQKLVFGVQAHYQDAAMQVLGVSEIGGIIYLNYQLLLIALAVVVVVSLRLLMRHTRLGKLILAVVADPEVSVTLGINARQVYSIAFTIGVFLAALGGALATPTSGVAPGLGAEAIVLGFAVAAIGGLGQIEGAALAAVIVGLSRVIAIYYAPAFEPVMPYLVMLVVLLVRPYGLFGTAQARRI